MSNSVTRYSSATQKSPLAQWINKTLWLRGLGVKFKLHGNNLHILCESAATLDQVVLLTRLLFALQQTDVNTLVPDDQPRIYQVVLYGRKTGGDRPLWSTPIYLNQIDRHIEQLRQRHPSVMSQMQPAQHSVGSGGVTSTIARPDTAETADTRSSNRGSNRGSSGAALVLSNRSLARQGKPEGIARYLSETLSTLGVSVRVTVKTLPYQALVPQSGVAYPAVPSGLGVAPGGAIVDSRRLWITCDALYSPDPMLIGEPVAHQLRELELEGFKDAVIAIQVRGEQAPDWMLQVDLTPANELLREWARWGDVGAIAHVIHHALEDTDIRLSTASLQESSLHLFFGLRPSGQVNGQLNGQLNGQPNGQATDQAADQATGQATGQAAVQKGHAPSRDSVKALIVPLLDTLGPQGIQAAAIYGLISGQEAPDWVDWLELPAAKHSALAELPIALAKQQDWEAIAFLLQRLLNPDLDRYLATGGIRLQLLPKHDLLHVMTDAPVCPAQHQVGPAVAQFFKQLQLPEFTGVRVYGRRAGQARPLWSYGKDFVSRDRLVPEATPEFAATDAYIGELIAQPGDTILRPDLTPEDLRNAWTNWSQRVMQGIQHILVRSYLFTPIADAQDMPALPPAKPSYQGVGVVAVWGTVGLLLALQMDWGFGRLLRSLPSDAATAATPAGELAEPPSPVGELVEPPSPTLSLSPSPSPTDSAENSDPPDELFDMSGFTADPAASPTPSATGNAASGLPGETPSERAGKDTPDPSDPAAAEPPAEELPYTLQTPEVRSLVASVLAEEPLYPTFNSRQFDEKLQVYHHYLEQEGTPDVLIVGSSRALRGVDPVALQESLAQLGYRDVKVFNFGINGATAQVVDLLLRRLLPPDQLPRLIVWADGARAFNSGTVDVTYNGIAASEGYRQLSSGALPPLTATDVQPISSTAADKDDAAAPLSGGFGKSLTESYQTIDRWFSQTLGKGSAVYGDRDRLKQWVKSLLIGAFPPSLSALASVDAIAPVPTTEAQVAENPDASPDESSLLLANQNLMDLNGFLPLAVQFNPATYYQQYARVAGAYDSDYEDFRIIGKQEDALNAILAFTRSKDIPVVFVNLPLTKDYLDPTRMEHEQTFKQYMLTVAVKQGGLIFRDLGEVWPADYNYFSDPSHLNRYGAYQVAERIAQDPIIPWFQRAP